MVRITATHAFVLLVFVDITASFLGNETIGDVANHIKKVKTRRHDGERRKKHKSTSSSKDRGVSEETEAESLSMSSEGVTSSAASENPAKKVNKYRPKSSEERKGWRKWHRKCTPCREDQVKKWRDPSIKWICGAFQRARRTFKSLCMMHYRNCQDGTMFTKLHDHRCANDTEGIHGDHFFYEFHVTLTDDDESQSEVSTSEEKSSSTS